MKRLSQVITLSSLCVAGQSYADIPLYETKDRTLYANLNAVAGVFYSKKNYIPNQDSGSVSWQEAYLQYGLGFNQKIDDFGELYGRANLVTAGTWGDGDAAGFTNGKEWATKIEDAYIGWKSGKLWGNLAENAIDISFGRQSICLGDGFLICADAPNVGQSSFLGEEFDRHGGGTYYLAGHRDFKDTVMLKLIANQSLNGSLFTFKSSNPIQAYSRFSGATIDYSPEEKTNFGFTFLHNESIDKGFASLVSPILLDRKNMNVYSIRGNSNLAMKNSEFSFEYAVQDKKSVATEVAGYIKAEYHFELPFKPNLFYRYSRFSENWDNLFIGAMEYGKWFQGEVAYNYSGPFNSNTQISNLGLSLSPNENITFGALAYDFSTLKKTNNVNYDGRELDLYALWVINSNITLSPLIGLYKPDADSKNSGIQNGDKKTNFYTQLSLSMSY